MQFAVGLHATDPLEQMHSPYVALCNDPANYVDPDGRAGIHLSDWDRQNILGCAIVLASAAAFLNIGQALQGASGISQGCSNLSKVPQAVETVKGALSFASSAFSGAVLTKNTLELSDRFETGGEVGLAKLEAVRCQVVNQGKSGGTMGTVDNGDPVKTNSQNYTPKCTFESTKEIREALGFQFSVGIGAFSWGESVYSSFANMSFESCLLDGCFAVLDNLSFRIFSNLKSAIGITSIGQNLINGEYSLSDIGFGIGFVGAPTAIGYGFGGMATAIRSSGLGLRIVSSQISKPHLTYSSTNLTSSPIVGAGAKLSYLGSNVGRIQNIATKYDLEISVVGSRAKGTATVISDWDYIINGGNSKSRSSALFQLPKNIRATKNGNPIPGSEILKGVPLNKNLPHITFKPIK